MLARTHQAPARELSEGGSVLASTPCSAPVVTVTTENRPVHSQAHPGNHLGTTIWYFMFLLEMSSRIMMLKILQSFDYYLIVPILEVSKLRHSSY